MSGSERQPRSGWKFLKTLFRCI